MGRHPICCSDVGMCDHGCAHAVAAEGLVVATVVVVALVAAVMVVVVDDTPSQRKW